MPDSLTLLTERYRLWAYATPEDSPYLHDEVELMREEWETPILAYPRLLPPQMNVAGLFWRTREDTPHA
jgi:hypothetical protein